MSTYIFKWDITAFLKTVLEFLKDQIYFVWHPIDFSVIEKWFQKLWYIPSTKCNEVSDKWGDSK